MLLEAAIKMRKDIDFCQGPILKSIVSYSIPIIILSLIGVLYSVIGTTILSFFASDDAVAAVGAPGHVTGLITSFVSGLTVGSNVMIARCVGARNEKQARQYVGTSIFMGIVSGFLVAAVVFLLSKPFLIMTKCDPEILDMALIHMRLSCIIMPISMVNGFAATILRSVGDTIRPTKYALISGALNIVFNLLFNGVLGLGYLSVSISSLLSTICSTVPCVLALLKETGYGKLEKEHIKFYPRMAFNIFRNGIPVGIQSCLFTISGVMLQTSINSFGKEATAAQSMAGSVSGITYSIVAAFSQALLVFVSQNYGARRIDRIKKAIPQSMILSASVTLGMGIIINLARSPICHIFTQDSVVIHYMYTNFFYWGIFQCINSIMEVLNNVVKGLGRPITSMVAALTGNLAVTFIWLRTAFVKFPTIEVVYMSYPAAWIVSTVIFIFLTAIIWKKAKEEMTEGKILE